MTSQKVVGVLYGGYPQPWHEPFTQRLSASYEVDSRYAKGQWGDNIQQMANELVGREVDVLVTMDTPAMDAVTRLTDSIPTVSLVCRAGITGNLRPTGNLTGLVNKEIDTARQLRMLVELLRANEKPFSPIAVIYNASNRAMDDEIAEIEEAAETMDPVVEIRRLPIEAPDYDFDKTLAGFGDAKGLIVLEEPVTVQNRKAIAAFALSHDVPGMYETRTFLEEGGLVCYGPDRHDMYLQMADYVREIADKDLQPGHLPPMHEVEPALFLNRTAAENLGLNVIPPVLDGVRWAG